MASTVADLTGEPSRSFPQWTREWSEPHEVVAGFLPDGGWTARMVGLADPAEAGGQISERGRTP